MNEDLILDIIQKSELKNQFASMKQSFFILFETQRGFALSDEENLALAKGVLDLMELKLFRYIVPIWFEAWVKERDNS